MGLTRVEAMQKTKVHFSGKAEFVNLVDRNLEYLGPESNSQTLKLLANVETLLS